MKENYYASVCHHGMQGGAIRLTEEFFLFRCQKVSIENEFKRIEIRYSNIEKISYKRKFFVFPVVAIEQCEGKIYKFVIFNIQKFIKNMKSRGVRISHIK